MQAFAHMQQVSKSQMLTYLLSSQRNLTFLFELHFQSRTDLEQQSIDTANTSEAVGLITQVQGLKRKMKVWEKQVDVSTRYTTFYTTCY